MEKLTKKDIKGPDAFIKQAVKASEFVEKHKKTIIASFLGIIAVILVAAGWGYYVDQQEQKAQLSYYEVMKKLKTLDDKNTQSLLTAAEELKDITLKFSLTQTSVLSALEASRIYSQLNKNDEAINLLEKASKKASSPTVKAISLTNLASQFEAKGEYQKAIDTLNQIEAREDMAFMHGQVLLKKGLSFEKLGQKDKAEQMYKKAEGLTKYPDVVNTAKKYLRAL